MAAAVAVVRSVTMGPGSVPVPQQLDQLDFSGPKCPMPTWAILAPTSSKPQPVGAAGSGKIRLDPTRYGCNLVVERVPPFVFCLPKHGRLSAKFLQIARCPVPSASAHELQMSEKWANGRASNPEFCSHQSRPSIRGFLKHILCAHNEYGSFRESDTDHRLFRGFTDYNYQGGFLFAE